MEALRRDTFEEQRHRPVMEEVFFPEVKILYNVQR